MIEIFGIDYFKFKWFIIDNAAFNIECNVVKVVLIFACFII